LEEKLAETSRMIQPQQVGLKDCMPLLEDCVTEIVAVRRDLSHLTGSQRLLQNSRIKSNPQQTMLNASKEELSALRNRLDNLQSQLKSSNKKSQSQELRLISVMEELQAVKNNIINEAEQQKVIRSQELDIKLLKLNVTALKKQMNEINLRLNRRQPSGQPSGQR
jgi:chromosome segregation ATPase